MKNQNQNCPPVRRRGNFPLFAAAILFASVIQAQAQVVLSSLGDTISNAGIVSSALYKAQPFTTASSGPFELISVTLDFATPTNTSGNFFVAIMQGAIQPNDLLPVFDLAGTTNPATAGNHTFTADGVILAADTTYWIVAGVDSGPGFYKWNFATDDTYQIATWTPVDTFAASGDAGASWTLFTGASAQPYLFSVSATAVPEPSTWGLLAGAAALTGTMIVRRRVRRA